MTKSDKDLWSALPLSDIWFDAGLHNVWSYLLANKHLKIPDSWQDAIHKFDRELSDLDTWLIQTGVGGWAIKVQECQV